MQTLDNCRSAELKETANGKALENIKKLTLASGLICW